MRRWGPDYPLKIARSSCGLLPCAAVLVFSVDFDASCSDPFPFSCVFVGCRNAKKQAGTNAKANSEFADIDIGSKRRTAGLAMSCLQWNQRG